MRPTAKLMAMAVVALTGMISRATAHLEVNIVTGPFAAAPVQHNTPVGKDPKILCRTAIVAGDQLGRNPNDPSAGHVCHGKPMLTDPDKLATLTAGGDFQWEVLKERLGSGHDGGHCSWWVSAGTDQTKWYKFMDDIDCTANIQAGIQGTKVRILKELPKSCTKGCTLNWLWSPLHTGKCEIYSNCFDVKINGAEGGIEENYPMKSAPFECIRPNTDTHKTSAFGRFINVHSDDTVELEQVIDGDQNCYQYTVRNGDIIDQVRAKFDISVDELYLQNVDVMPSKTTLPTNGTKLTIAGCKPDDKDDKDDKKTASDATGLLHVLVVSALGVLVLSF